MEKDDSDEEKFAWAEARKGGFCHKKLRAKRDCESAIVKVGEAEGKFDEVNGLAIERDRDYPIRVTLQFYKSTATGVIEDSDILTIYEQIMSASKKADYIGSLVVGRTTRPTEPKKAYIPLWWDTFWLLYQSRYSTLSQDRAKALLFSTARFASTTMDESEATCRSILAEANSPSSSSVDWNPV
eukprot:TRINITY_DN3951_c0_g1_i5.p1 TRINITY_DN3951_c0_g1~~TRINITY_DN3951_c0_g1_i5.p1  ORF type:complete len:184 (+),score=31.10 TRINITY_DN3951_c0_g1_i5:162-713(+)